MSFAATLPGSCPDEWRRATEHRFVHAVADGTLPRSAFHEWLRQDFLFVLGLAGFVRELAADAPATDREALVSAAAALGPELDLFHEYAESEGIDLGADANEACTAYLRFLDECRTRGYASGLAAYYACERSYLEAWTHARENASTDNVYMEWIENWSSAPFRAFVDELGERLDAAAADLDEPAFGGLRDVFARTVSHEVAFWDACWPG